jgi:predicted deoxyguanosinetriphosphate triphosphohydrolase
LIKPWGHKDNTILNSDVPNYKENMMRVYCAILFCTSGLRRHRVSSNTAISRVTEYIKYIRETEDKKELYKILRISLDTAEFPYREGGVYSRLLICYPPKDIKGFIDELSKPDENEQDTTDEEELRKKEEKKEERRLRKEKFEYICKINGIKSDIPKMEEMLYRNEAIYAILFFEVHGPLRTRYMRETERIVKSEYFRYMQYKAQVMFNNASDDQRTRLTHSLEVAFSAKTIAKQLGCNWELAEAAAMGHDLGHVPFGHQGEEALDECLHKAWAGRFSHALQSVRVLGYLANHSFIHSAFGVNGLYISRPILECVLKHDTDNLLHDIRKPSWRLQYNGWREALIGINRIPKEGNESEKGTEIKFSEEEFNNGVTLGGLESQIVYWADKISYASHDWEELTNNRIIEKMADDVEKILKDMHQLRHITHAREGNRIPVSDITNELDVIRFIRDYIERIRSGLIITSATVDKTATRENQTEENQTEEDRIIKTFNHSNELFEYYERKDSDKEKDKIKDKDRCFSYNRIINKDTDKSPLVCFLDGLYFIIKNYVDKNNEFVSLFTKEQYKLIYDFFFLCHNLIFITGVYPKAYKKTDDIVIRLRRYMAEINGREMTKSLIPQLIRASREVIRDQLKENKKFDEAFILKKCMESFYDINEEAFDVSDFPNVKSLASARKELAKYGYFVPNTNLQYKFPNDKLDTKKLKKCFKNELQSKMMIKLPVDILKANNHIADFVYKYYIGSERVRAMKNKAHMIIKQIFEFYMGHSDMLPEEKIQLIDKEAQNFCTLRDDFYGSDGKTKYSNRLLVIQYLLERLDESSMVSLGKIAIEKIEEYSHLIRLLEVLTDSDSQFNYEKQRDYGGKEFYNLLVKWYKKAIHSELKDHTIYDLEEYYNVCRHIAKARVIADYIASMTERFAEKKYTEIVSSQASWTTAYFN